MIKNYYECNIEGILVYGDVSIWFLMLQIMDVIPAQLAKTCSPYKQKMTTPAGKMTNREDSGMNSSARSKYWRMQLYFLH